MSVPASSPAEDLPRQSIYNPSRLTDAEIKASYIARETLLEALLEDVDATRSGGIPQHHLLIGQRGMGKTTLLRRLEVALREPPRARRFVPLSFPEEQWTIDRLSKLWLNCLDALADTLEQSGDDAIVERIDALVSQLATEHERENLLAEAAEAALLGISSRIGRLPVLLVDNLDLVFDRLEAHELSRLRAFLMRPNAPILIGACVSPPAQTQTYQAPFYEHFKTHYLGRLSLEEMREVLLRLAERSGNQEIPARLDAERPRLIALHALTGGNPRTTVMLFQIFARGFSQEAFQDLEILLDSMTPLYKARFEEFPAQAQVILSALAMHWEPATSAQLSEATRLENKQVSPQLDRLKRAGVIEEVLVDREDRVGPVTEGRSPGTRIGYQIAERFFNIWFLMRHATRRDRRSLTFLTRFIESVHTPAERSALARNLLCRRSLSRGEQSLVSVLRDQLDASAEAQHLASTLPIPSEETLAAGVLLHPALIAAYAQNWGAAAEHLGSAIDLIAEDGAFLSNTFPGWMRATAVLLHFDCGSKLLEFLRGRGDDFKLRPWYEAIRAHLRGDRRYLRNIPVEMREVSGMLYDAIDVRLRNLPGIHPPLVAA